MRPEARIFTGVALAALVIVGVGTIGALAQQVVSPCVSITASSCQPISTSAPMPVNSVFESGFAYTHIASNASTVIKAAPGVLHTLMIGSKGTSSETATLYDNTTCTGTVIAVVDLAGNDATSQNYDIAFATGLCIATAGGTAGDITVSYK